MKPPKTAKKQSQTTNDDYFCVPDMSKSQVDPGLRHFFASGQGMLPELLRASGHQQQAAMLQVKTQFAAMVILAPQQEIPARPQA